MGSPVRHSPLSCLIVFFALMLLAAAATAGITAWLAYLRPEKGIEWPAFVWLGAGFLVITILILGFAWLRVKSSSSSNSLGSQPENNSET